MDSQDSSDATAEPSSDLSLHADSTTQEVSPAFFDGGDYTLAAKNYYVGSPDANLYGGSRDVGSGFDWQRVYDRCLEYQFAKTIPFLTTSYRLTSELHGSTNGDMKYYLRVLMLTTNSKKAFPNSVVMKNWNPKPCGSRYISETYTGSRTDMYLTWRIPKTKSISLADFLHKYKYPTDLKITAYRSDQQKIDQLFLHLQEMRSQLDKDFPEQIDIPAELKYLDSLGVSLQRHFKVLADDADKVPVYDFNQIWQLFKSEPYPVSVK